jgi:hypothetical protein
MRPPNQAVFFSPRTAAVSRRDVAGFRLPVDARRHMRRLRTAFIYCSARKTQDLKNSVTRCQTLARQIPSSPERQMVTSGNRFAKLAVPPRESAPISRHSEIKYF